MRRHHLNRAIVLGLLLSTAMSGSVWAEDLTAAPIVVNTSEQKEYTITEDTEYDLTEDAWITNNGGSVTIEDSDEGNHDLSITTDNAKSINSTNGTNHIVVGGDFSLKNESSDKSIDGVYNFLGSSTTIKADGNITIESSANEKNSIIHAVTNKSMDDRTGESGKENTIEIVGGGTVSIKATSVTASDGNAIHSSAMSMTEEGVTNTTSIMGEGIEVAFEAVSRGDRINAGAIYAMSGGLGTISNTITLTGTGELDNTITSSARGIQILANAGDSSVNVTSEKASNNITSKFSAIDIDYGNVRLHAENGVNKLESEQLVGQGLAVITSSSGYVELLAKQNEIIGHDIGGIYGSPYSKHQQNPDQEMQKIMLKATDGDNLVTTERTDGIYSSDGYIVELIAESGNNSITGKSDGNTDPTAAIVKTNGGTIRIHSQGNGADETGNNFIYSDNPQSESYYKLDALRAAGLPPSSGGSASGAEVAEGRLLLTADNANTIYGSMTAETNGTISISGKQNSIIAATISDDVPSVPSTSERYHYAVQVIGGKDYGTDNILTRANIHIQATDGGKNEIISQGIHRIDETSSERAIFATEGGSITIDGASDIVAGSWENNTKKDFQSSALIAGTYDWDVNSADFTMNDEERSVITLNYGTGSNVIGDIVAGYGGKVSVTEQENTSRISTFTAGPAMTLQGNAMAANGGKINLELGSNSIWTGRADDYQDAAEDEWKVAHTDVFNPVFTNNIQKNGQVDITLGNGAMWDVNGQSWVSKLDGNNGTVILNGRDTGGYALHIGELAGTNTFAMNVTPENGDMLYIKSVSDTAGTQKLDIQNPDEVLSYMQSHDKVRFASLANGKVDFENVTIDGAGVFKKTYTVTALDSDDTRNDFENDMAYNGTADEGTIGEDKAGNDYVEANYDEANLYLTEQKPVGPEQPLTKAGKTIIAMSKVNYSNAIYMDRLNKRMGEARYIDGDEGLWVRIRHDRIGKSDAFRSKNTMMELGYDKRVDDREDGEHRRGFAIDYMRGTAEYHNVAGDGDVRRGGVWFYDTWLGNKGHYSDYVLKFGRLSNDFDIYSELGEKITGDYSNFVYSASAEYGRKKDIGKDWYFEPQVQLQYAHVTDADYTTSQGTSVELDAIDSLIGRVGFRLGKDMGENNTFYIKVDVLHEFLGDQDISAFDDTGRLDTTYENEGTWYDVGLGFSHQFSKGTYMFLDVEKTFGNDNEDTYQFNVGMNWKV